MSGVLIIIPAFNEEECIEASIRDLQQSCDFDICVVNDGSTDATEEIAASLGVKLATSPTNIGYSKAISMGLDYAIRHEYSTAVTFDADRQFNSVDIHRLLMLLSPDTALVVGSRSRKQRASEFYVGLLTALLYKVPDPFCGFKAINLTLLRDFIAADDDSLVNTRLLSLALRRKMNVHTVPISHQDRINTNSRFGSGIKAEIKLLKAFLKWYLR